jgi:acyl-coenzyme A thioesterase PaaI-like protein
MTESDLSEPGPEWIRLRGAAFGKVSFVSSNPSETTLRVRYYRHRENSSLRARIWFGPGSEGLPGHAHGGSVAAVLDEGTSLAAWLAGYPVASVQLVVDFESLIMLGQVAILDAAIDTVEDDRIEVHGVLRSETGKVFARGRSRLFRLSAERLKRIPGGEQALEAVGKPYEP